MRPDSTDCGPWDRPARIAQGELFNQPHDRLLAQAGVSIDEVERWRALGWISYDVRDVSSLDLGRVSEICFIRNLARSGLGDLQIGTLLDELERPYLYDPVRTAYSFAFGWVQLPPLQAEDDNDAFIEHHLSAWIKRKVLLGEYELLEGVCSEMINSVACARAAERPEVESE